MSKKVCAPGPFILLSVICIVAIAKAQLRWQRTYGGTSADWANSVQPTTDGGYIVGGTTESFGAGSQDVYLVKTAAQGDTLWTRTYGGESGDEGYSVRQTNDSGYVIAGSTRSFGSGMRNVYLIKTDAQGDTLWTRTYGGPSNEYGTSVQQTADGGYIIAGYTASFGAGDYDFYLIKTDAQGDTLWTRTYGGTSADWVNSVQQTTDGGYIVAGMTYSFGPWAPDSADVYVIRTNASGDTLWTRTYGGASGEDGKSVQQTDDGCYIITGSTTSFGAGNLDVYLIKANASGDTLWTRTIGGTNSEVGFSVRQTTDGGYAATGFTYSFGAGDADVYLIKTNSSGDTAWTRTFGGADRDGGNSVRQTIDGGYIVAGFTLSSGSGGGDVYLIKTDANGNLAVADDISRPQATILIPDATVVRSLAPGATAYDAMGRRDLHPKPGIYFLKTSATAAPRKVLLVE